MIALLFGACRAAALPAERPARTSPAAVALAPTATALATSTVESASPAVEPAEPLASMTPLPAATRVAQYVDSLPAAAFSAPGPVGTVAFYESSVTIPTYPVDAFQSDALSPVYDWPYRRTDIEAFRASNAAPVARTYATLILENQYLLITILPELGGRILQVVHKPTGTRMFYNNKVVKPTAWGPPEQAGWLALGGLEWDLPVEEHGLAWGEAWGYIPLVFSTERAAVTVFTPQDGRALTASITIELLAGAASFSIEPTITNVSDQSQRFNFWHNAMLAPGSGAGISPAIHFVLPTDSMMVHSTGDVRLPAAGQRVTWPIYNGRDLSRLATWSQYAGMFESPAAHGPFAAVYDTQQDAGAVRTFPAGVAQGSKIFALGGSAALSAALYTDDATGYVELHGGLAPTFAQQSELAPGDAVSWRESWYPVAGMGDLATANELVALDVQTNADGVTVALFAAHPLDADILLLDAAGAEVARMAVSLNPSAAQHIAWPARELDRPVAAVHLENVAGSILTYALPGSTK